MCHSAHDEQVAVARQAIIACDFTALKLILGKDTSQYLPGISSKVSPTS